jgi:methylenetetrahydrofolate dehydrogenase (NADP+)/methenyltetrahydrofolate cyclohydrolase
MGKIINVGEIVQEKKENLKIKIEELKKQNVIPKLAVIIANDEVSSKLYVKNKRKVCDELGIEGIEYNLDEKVTTKEIIDLICKLNKDISIDGILVQLPLFKHLNKNEIINSIDSRKDVDGFHPLNLGKLVSSNDGIVACTPKGVMSILENISIEIMGKEAVVVGRSIEVGKPISALLLSKGATVTTCHSKTIDLKSHTKRADILVVAVGVPHLITKDMVKENATVIDVGINRVEGQVVGDVDTIGVLEAVEYITPVPGGVGLTTVISLIENLVDIASKRVEK